MKASSGKRSRKTGMPPGSLVHVGREPSGPTKVTVLDYDAENLTERVVEDVRECFPFKETATVTWINVDAVSDPQIVAALGDHFGLHPLVQEDILNTNQRPKMEDFESYMCLTLRMLRVGEGQRQVVSEQVTLVIGKNFVITFQEREGDVFDAIRERLRQGKGRIRGMGPDYLAYCLLDAVVDGYFVIIEQASEWTEELEEELLRAPTPRTLQAIHRLKREGLYVRKAVWPLREAVASLERVESPLVDSGTRVYLRDVYDHTIQVIETLETLRDVLSGMVDTYLSSVSNRMNEVMKVLTIIATIFIPLTFIAGVYGMNLEMPETGWSWSYPAVWGVMLVVAGWMVMYFRRRKWL